ncbi:hypothetical protein WUBG_00066 [Wuchereria bancrofti]|uniref:Uncharacterized protein n=1 Tax=Wuchereria bancrofti TaxID=6293 RepID=J9F2B4_WUCBA|nr:hypothetical protein WUBG_00066 [Wuchereria bancrofti]
MGTYNAPTICPRTIRTHNKQTPAPVLKAEKDESPDMRDASPNSHEVALYHYDQAFMQNSIPRHPLLIQFLATVTTSHENPQLDTSCWDFFVNFPS